MARIAATDGGTYYHYESLHGPRYRGQFAELLYLPELGDADFAAFDAIVVTCRSNPDLLAPHAPKFAAFLEQGGTVVAMGETDPAGWLPGIDFRMTPTNFWWWLEKGADSGLRAAAPSHTLFGALALKDMTWHHHGRFTPPPGAVSVVDHAEGGSILYDDRVTTPGRMIVTSLDPFYHHGSRFMPATTRFLDGFLPWLHAELG
jgi:hypothetical protein